MVMEPKVTLQNQKLLAFGPLFFRGAQIQRRKRKMSGFTGPTPGPVFSPKAGVSAWGPRGPKLGMIRLISGIRGIIIGLRAQPEPGPF